MFKKFLICFPPNTNNATIGLWDKILKAIFYINPEIISIGSHTKCVDLLS